MIIIDNPAAMARALASPIDVDLRRLLTLRREQLGGDAAARFVIAEPPDTAADLEAAIGFPFTVDLDGVCAGDPDFSPWHDWAQRHPGWVEFAFVLSDGGPAEVLLLPDRHDLALALPSEHA